MTPLHAAKEHCANYQPAMGYEPLPIEVTQNGGHHYRQKWRDDYAAVYEQRNPFGAFLGYEAVAIKRQEADRVFGRNILQKRFTPARKIWESSLFPRPISTGQWALRGNIQNEPNKA